MTQFKPPPVAAQQPPASSSSSSAQALKPTPAPAFSAPPYASSFLSFIDSVVTVYHTVSLVSSTLRSHGFEELQENEVRWISDAMIVCGLI
jgi:hypothetical protein